jgi:hypothetical protein
MDDEDRQFHRDIAFALAATLGATIVMMAMTIVLARLLPLVMGREAINAAAKSVDFNRTKPPKRNLAFRSRRTHWARRSNYATRP